MPNRVCAGTRGIIVDEPLDRGMIFTGRLETRDRPPHRLVRVKHLHQPSLPKNIMLSRVDFGQPNTPAIFLQHLRGCDDRAQTQAVDPVYLSEVEDHLVDAVYM